MANSTYRLTPNELSLWLHYIEHQVGFVLPNAQIEWIKWVIERHLAANGLSNTDFLAAIATDKQRYHRLFDDILIPRTQFFRHPLTFSFIEQYAKAWQVANMARETETARPFTAWSVGCSTGQEPLSIAMTLKSILPTHSAFTVFGSDFHQKALQQAQRGKYELNELDLVPPLYRYWLMKQDDSLVIANRLQQHLQYFSLNLVQPPPSLPIQPGQCQLIVCQNVLIYFRQFVQRDVIKYLTQFLAEDGVLILGSGEILRLNQRELVRLPTHQVDAYVKQNAPSWLMTLSE